jgi:predicted PurR-regulated permease PerM
VQVIGNVMEPIVFGHGMELHPVTVLLALALWCVR